MSDWLDILDGDDPCASQAIADALRATSSRSAEILDAQIAYLRSGDIVPHEQGPVGLGDVWMENLTVLSRDGRSWAWVRDDDLVTLTDGGLFNPKKHRDPWEANVAAEAALRRLPPCAIRLCLFEGVSRVAKAAAEIGIADSLTHLDLQLQREGQRQPPVAESFPLLRGLRSVPSACADLLAEGAPFLRSLVVNGKASVAEVLALTEGLPTLRHLGLWRSIATENELDVLLGHPTLARLTSLDLWDVNDAARFPFAALLARRDRIEHLRSLVLPAHTVPEATKQRFRDWRAVTFVSFDRREVRALDLETIG
jgi:hypothetical protein